MNDTQETQQILARAQGRAREMNLPYAGALTPQEAWMLLQALPQARLVDVRTQAEWQWVGRVPNAVEIEWNTWPGGRPNPDFIAQLRQFVPADAPVLFMCRSGVRSNAASIAATEAGYAHSYNILGGFEGDKDEHNHRNTVNGWRVAGLPWGQG